MSCIQTNTPPSFVFLRSKLTTAVGINGADQVPSKVKSSLP